MVGSKSETAGRAEAFRRRFFENADPIGARVGIGGATRAADYEIVGVVEDVKYIAPREAVRPMVPAQARLPARAMQGGTRRRLACCPRRMIGIQQCIVSVVGLGEAAS